MFCGFSRNSFIGFAVNPQNNMKNSTYTQRREAINQEAYKKASFWMALISILLIVFSISILYMLITGDGTFASLMRTGLVAGIAGILVIVKIHPIMDEQDKKIKALKEEANMNASTEVSENFVINALLSFFTIA
jgi:hypothetical protein